MPTPEATRMVGYVGAAANWLIPITTINNIYSLPASQIDPVMTSVLTVYSTVFFRWALAVAPANYPLAACHVTNGTAQLCLLAKKALYGGDQNKK